LGFWIAWFWYQKLKIFTFEYLTWKQRILPREGSWPEFCTKNSISITNFVDMFLGHTLSRIGIIGIVSFWIKSGDPCWLTQITSRFFSLKWFYLTSTPHQSCSPGRVDKFGLLNRLILISEAQDIPVWIYSVKARIPAARRIFARVCRDTIARCLKFEDQLQANLKPFFGLRTKWKRC
jgi:hypothetical protein